MVLVCNEVLGRINDSLTTWLSTEFLNLLIVFLSIVWVFFFKLAQVFVTSYFYIHIQFYRAKLIYYNFEVFLS